MSTFPGSPTGSHKGPDPAFLAILFTILFITGLAFVVSFTPGKPYYPYPYEQINVIEGYFRNNGYAVLLCAFFQFGAAVPLALYTAAMVSRLRYHGVTAAGTNIALFGGFAAAIDLFISSLLMWTLAQPVISQNNANTGMLYYSGFAIGGVGYSVPLGLLIAGIAVTGLLSGLLPKWLAITGIVIAAIGELSWFNLAFPWALALIPLTRFPGFIWLIVAGFKLPKTRRMEISGK